MTEIKNPTASVRQKLLNIAKRDRVDYQRTLVRYAIERLLYRLARHASADRFVLKGAMLFLTWPERIFRPSGDLDLLGFGPADAVSIRNLFSEICAIEDPRDGITFDSNSIDVQVVREGEDEYQGVRVRLDAYLGTARIRVLADVGFGDYVHPDPQKIRFPCLLDGMATPEILAYPAQTVVAEKLEAMVRYGLATSRLKDLYDVWTISKTFSFDMASLAEAIRGTFTRRETPLPTGTPLVLDPSFAEIPAKLTMWQGFLHRNPPAIDPPPLATVLADLRQFILPILSAMENLDAAAEGHWDPDARWTR